MPPRETPVTNGNLPPAYQEFRVPVPSRGIEQQIGVYIRAQDSVGKDGSRVANTTVTNSPPVIVIVGGLGFGGPVPANGWRSYLPNWNPILVDSRGAGLSYPLGNLIDNTPNRVLDDIEMILTQTGLKEIGFVGYSYAGNLALKAAERAIKNGVNVPFVAATSPVLCTNDRDWCFDSMRSQAQGASPQDINRAWTALTDRVTFQPGQKTADAVLETYDRLLNRNTNADDFLDAAVRMINWELRPYNCPFYTMDSYKELLRRASLIPVNELLERAMRGEVDIKTMFKDITMAKSDEARAEINESHLALRRLANIKIWTNAWANNCWENPETGLLPTMTFLRNARVPALICINRQDPLLPVGQEKIWQTSWPEAVRVFDVKGHGLADPLVERAFFSYLEQQRAALAKPDNARNVELRTSTRYRETDLRDAVGAVIARREEVSSADPLAIAAVAFMLSPGSEKGMVAQTANLIVDRLKSSLTAADLRESSSLIAWIAQSLSTNGYPSRIVKRESLVAMSEAPLVAARELERLSFLAVEKAAYLETRAKAAVIA